MKTWIYAAGLLGLLVAACDGRSDAPKPATPAAVQETTARGFGKSHEDAYAEACAQAVSQVCGIRIDKALLSAGEKRGAIGAATFSGALQSAEELSTERAEDGTYTVTVRARVCPPADPFAGRVALVLPRAASVGAALGNLREPLARRLALAADDALKAVADADGNFVVLNRDAGDADAERRLARSQAARADEFGKSQGLKVADEVVELQILEATEEREVRAYEIAQTARYKGKAHIEYALRLIEPTTNAVVATERGSATAACTTARSEEKCADKLESALCEAWKQHLAQSLRALLRKCSQ